MQSVSRKTVAGGRVFSHEARVGLIFLADRYSITLDYTSDSLGNELLGLLAKNHERRVVSMVYPTADGFVAEDEASDVFGCFATADELCGALSVYLDKFAMSEQSH